MRNAFLLLLMVGVAHVGRAQKTPGDTTKPRAPQALAQAIDVTQLQPAVTPKSPTAAALGRYGEYPVSMYTGLPTIEIPIHEFTVGNLTVPIKLTYHASGNKVSDRASWVGMGWSLQTGGMITRNVLSRPDEQDAGGTGTLNRTITQPIYNPACPTDATDLPVRFLADNITDSQRDLFAYQTPAGSNSFVLRSSAGSSNAVTFLRAEPAQLVASSGLSSFTLTDPTGIRYRFADSEAASIPSPPAYGYSSYTSTWYLNEIVSLNTSERAIYTYTAPFNQPSAPEPIDTWVVIGNLFEVQTNDAGVNPGLRSQTTRDGGLTIGARLPQEIHFPGGKISFALEDRAGGGYNLDYIDVFSYEVATNKYVPIKRFDLQYVNKTRTPCPTVGGGNEPFLDGIQLLEGNGTTVIGNYAFTYNALALPDAGCRTKDYWGYYNNNPGSTLIAQRPFTYTPNTNGSGPTTMTIGDANRDPDPTKMQAWLLQSIRYPTGGSTQFDFETNRYTENGNQKLAGGLRVKQIRSYTAANQLATRLSYRYGVGESGNGTFRANLTLTYTGTLGFNFNQPAGTGSPKNFNYDAYTFSSSPTFPLSPDEGSPVTYPEVAQYAEDGAGNATGRTIFRFRDAAADAFLQLGIGKSFLTSRSWDRGQELSRTQYDASGNQRANSVTSYTTITSGQTADLAGILVQRSVQQLGDLGNNGTCNTIDDKFLPFRTYNFYYGLTRPASTTESVYDDDNSGRYTQKVTQTDYDPAFYQPRETRLLAEGGIVLGTRMSYPQDFGTTIPTNAGSDELRGIRALQDRNAYLPVETVQYRRESAMAPIDYKTGKLTTYKTITLNGLPTALPYQTYLIESVFNSFTPSDPYKSSAVRYTASGNNNSMFPIDPRFVARLTMDSYDGNGNLTAYTVADGPTTTFGYIPYTPPGGVLFSVVSGQTLNAGQPTAQTTSYTYQRPLLGPASMTDPRGVTTSYQYDNFGRLQTIKDKDGLVLKYYTYRYATQP